MDFSISVAPTNELNINNEIKLIKSVLLYADDITVNSLTATMLNIINNIEVTDRSILEIADIMEKVKPFMKMSDPNFAKKIDEIINPINSFKSFLTKKHRNKQEILIANKLRKPSPELEEGFTAVINTINNILKDSNYIDLGKSSDIVKFEQYRSTIDNTDEIMKEYFEKVIDSTNSLTKFPVLDDETANLVRLYEKENKISSLKPYIEKNSQGAIVSNMFMKLPSLDFISVDQLIELRGMLDKYLINFRKSIYEFSEKINCTQWDEEFTYQSNKLYSSEVLPQIQELEQRIKENSLIEKILKENYIDKTFWVTLVGTIAMAITNSNNLVQGIASASFVGNTLRNTIKASYDYQKNTKEIKNSTIYFFYKSNQEIKKL